MKYCKKLSLEKLESQNDKIENSGYTLLLRDTKRHPITKVTALITITTSTTSMDGRFDGNFTKCKINGRDNCFWCTRSFLKMDDNQIGVTDFEIVDPEDFFEEDSDVDTDETSFPVDRENSNENGNTRNHRYQQNLNEFLELSSDWEVIQTPTDFNQNFFSGEFEDEIVAAMSSRPTSPYCDIIDTDGCQLFSITFCEFLCFGHRIVNGIPEKPSQRAVFETTSSSPSSSSPPSSCKIKKSIGDRHKFFRSPTEEKEYRKNSKADAFARSIMGAIAKCQDCDSSNSDEIKDDRNCVYCDPFDIQEYFKLDDHDTILIDISHIAEERGHGFLMRRTKKCYRSVKCGIAINESYTVKKCFLEKIHEFFYLLKELLFGHPRNKTQCGGPGESVRAYTLQLANDHTSTFSRNIENFISCTKESREAAPQVVMRNMRQFMNGMKNYLVKHGEGDFHQEVQKARSRLKADEFLNLDAILEGVMHQLVVLPLREHLYGMFVDYYTRSSDIQLLVENVKYACVRNPADFGIRSTVTPPTSMQLNQISTLLVRLQEAELPLDKLDLFLCVIAAVFEATGCPRGQQLGADDFLPILVFVVAKCGFVGAEIEAEFMWGLLQPALLSGEAGYYLTALCSAVHVLKSFMASENEGTGSLDWRSSSLPACSSVLRVIIPDECNGSLQTRTLPVRPHTTTREVCRIIAHKARITNPQDYGLFKLVDGEETILADSECPQDARIAARGKHCILAYKRIDAKIAWPTATTQPSFA